MPIVNNLYQNDSWINKPHCMDESPPPLTIPILKPPPTPTTPQTDPTRRKSLALPPPPPPPFKKTNAIKRKSFCFSSTRRKTVDFSSLFRETTTKTGNSSVRPRSMDSLLPFPPPSVPPGSGIHEEKPLPAVPIESTVITPVSSPVTDDHFEPLTLKDITLILDRNDRMAAYRSAYEKCMNTPSPLISSIKTLKKKKPDCPQHQSSHRSSSCAPHATINSAFPRRSLTLPSLPSMITKKVAHLQYQLNMAEGYII